MYSLSRLVEKFGRSRRVEEASSVTHKLSFAARETLADLITPISSPDSHGIAVLNYGLHTTKEL